MDSIWGNIFRRDSKNAEAATGVIREVPLFEGLTRRELDRVRSLMHIREYAKDEVIFSQGVPGFGMYVIERGSVNIVYEPTGRVLAELADGDFFGELALLASTPRSAMAVATSQSRLFGFFHSDLKSLIEHTPKTGLKLAIRLATIVSERLVNANNRINSLQTELDEMTRKYEPV